jgi:hypothetical protein
MSLMKRAGSGPVSHRYGFEDPDPYHRPGTLIYLMAAAGSKTLTNRKKIKKLEKYAIFP